MALSDIVTIKVQEQEPTHIFGVKPCARGLTLSVRRAKPDEDGAQEGYEMDLSLSEVYRIIRVLEAAAENVRMGRWR